MQKQQMLLARSLPSLDNKNILRKGLGKKYLYLNKYDSRNLG